MKLKLDEAEMGAILIAWAKQKYKTHNVSVTYIINENKTTMNAIQAELEITLGESIVDGPVQLISAEVISKMHTMINSMPTTDSPDLASTFTVDAGSGGI